MEAFCNGHRGKKTNCNQKLNYDHIEDALITAFLPDVFDIVYKPQESKSLIKAKADLLQDKNNHENLKAQVEERNNAGKNIPDAIWDSLGELEKRIKEKTALTESIPSNPKLGRHTYRELQSGRQEPLANNFENRSMVRDIFKQIINSINVDFENKILRVNWYASDMFWGKGKKKTKVGDMEIKFDYSKTDGHDYKGKYPHLLIAENGKWVLENGSDARCEYRDNLLWR